MKTIATRKLLLGAVSLWLAGCTPAPVTKDDNGTRENLKGLELAGIKTEIAKIASLRPAVSLTGQVSATEKGQAIITAPLNGVILEPLITVGQRIPKGEPVAVVNSVYGQTALQLLQKLEQDQTTLVTGRTALASARSTLAQAQTALGQARAAEAQARDNLTEADAELFNGKKDLKRKQMLEKGGVFATSDVDDARERFVKADSAQRNAVYALRVARQAVTLAQVNVQMLGKNVPLSAETVNLAQANLERDKSVYSQGSLSGANLPQNLTPVGLRPGGSLSSSAAAESTSFYIRAPIEGVVTNVSMTAGLSVSPGTALATLVDTKTVYVDANAFESQLASIHVGDRLEVVAAAEPRKHFSGHVIYLGKQVDPTARTIPVRSIIENQGDLLRPSMYVTVKILAAARRSAVLVPENAVLIHGEGRFVFVETSPGKFEKRSVKVGLISDGQAEIIDGVRSGEKVVTDGNLILEGV